MDQKEFVKLYEKTKKRLFSYVLYKTHSETITEDIVSDVYIRLLREIEKNPEVIKYALQWLYRVASNRIVDHYRSSYHKRGVSEGEMSSKDDESMDRDIFVTEYEDVLQSFSEEEQTKVALAGLDELKVADREVIEYRLYEELPFKDIAVILESTEAAVKMKYKRAIDKLKAICEKKYGA